MISLCFLVSCDWLTFTPTSAFILNLPFVRPCVCEQTSLMSVRKRGKKKKPKTKTLQVGFPCSARLLNQNSLLQSHLIHVVCAAALRCKTQLQMSRHDGANVTQPRQISIDNWHFCVGPSRAGMRCCFSCLSQNTQTLSDGALCRTQLPVAASVQLICMWLGLNPAYICPFGGQ